MVAVLFVAAIISIVDRGILSLVVDPVRNDLAMTDVQIGLLQGLAFGVFYATVGVPLGVVADRTSRRLLIVFGILIWSLATVGAGFVESFGGLFVSRLLVGLGEATLGPATVSLIADLFPPDRRGKPLSVYLMGNALGSGLAIWLTGTILTAAENKRFAGIPFLADAAPWRAAFICCGLLGFIVVVLLLLTREPARRGIKGDPAPARPARERIAYVRRNAAVLAPLYFGFALCFLGAYASGAWAPTMLMRGRGLTPAEIGLWLAPFSVVFSLAGPFIGGIVVDRLAGWGRPMAKFALLVAVPVLAIPSALAVFAPGSVSAMFLVASSSAVYAVLGTITFALLQSIMLPDMRATSIAFTGLFNTMLGATLGPLLVAAVTTHVIGDPAKVGYGLAIVIIPSLVGGSALFALAWRAMAHQRRTGGEAATMLIEAEGRAATLRAERLAR